MRVVYAPSQYAAAIFTHWLMKELVWSGHSSTDELQH